MRDDVTGEIEKESSIQHRKNLPFPALLFHELRGNTLYDLYQHELNDGTSTITCKRPI